MAWFSRKPFSRKPAPPLPADHETAEAMRRLAETFISGAAVEGWHFGWDHAEALRLDEACEAFLRSDPPADVRHSMIMAMGAYLGEQMVRVGGGYWAYDAKERAAVVEMPNRLRAYPHNKVAKRLERGPEHSLAEFYQYALSGQLSPGSKLTQV
jgi:hypothetical protein